MTNLVIAEHDNQSIKAATLNTVAAAQKIGGDVHVLVAGHNAQAAADAAAKIAGVAKVLLADAPQLVQGLAEDVEATVLSIAKNYSHILAPATAAGKNVTPRIAAKLDVAQISDITAVDSPDTFERPIYAGNAIATVQSVDPIKVITVRTTAFDGVFVRIVQNLAFTACKPASRGAAGARGFCAAPELASNRAIGTFREKSPDSARFERLPREPAVRANGGSVGQNWIPESDSLTVSQNPFAANRYLVVLNNTDFG
ncbi:hypothetical protein PUN4_1120022 [Paraburkholderia unamae]|uniref:hypothetical protein n=1 Tax=Paraburkholderia unamae TaxID=219649 RepID=UPI001CB44E6A|nr:hypothetical protein [Paraburkholderia unamae]CAG9245996.1 hypothetical protein PUN4_1120022 [Paraburkholderia unamae]